MSKRDFSTFKIFPRKGNIAWNIRSLPCLALPPAESPSTIYISVSSALRLEQSANLPGKELISNAPLRRVKSLALRAAALARAEIIDFSTTFLATTGFSSKYSPKPSLTRPSTIPLNSLFPSLVLVWPSN